MVLGLHRSRAVASEKLGRAETTVRATATNGLTATNRSCQWPCRLPDFDTYRVAWSRKG